MSKRNSQDSKRAAVERLRAERERQAKRDKVRRQIIVGGSIVAVLAVAGGAGVAITKLNEGDSGSGPAMSSKEWTAAAEKKKLVKPENSSGAKGTTVVIGEKDAEKTLEVFEDMRCPACASFEQASGEILSKGIEDGKYKASFTMATFIDGMTSGSGSKNALSALGAALDVGPQAFLDYKTALYSKENHPPEQDDKFADDKYLLKVAEEIPELKGNKDFEKAVKAGTYDKWAVAMGEKFDKSDVKGTPSFKMDGEKLVVEGTDQTPMAPDQFQAAIEKALAAG